MTAGGSRSLVGLTAESVQAPAKQRSDTKQHIKATPGSPCLSLPADGSHTAVGRTAEAVPAPRDPRKAHSPLARYALLPASRPGAGSQVRGHILRNMQLGCFACATLQPSRRQPAAKGGACALLCAIYCLQGMD